eukprot:scaffold49789_cov48-Phaeocystis_antarctica.AAC.3
MRLAIQHTRYASFLWGEGAGPVARRSWQTLCAARLARGLGPQHSGHQHAGRHAALGSARAPVRSWSPRRRRAR